MALSVETYEKVLYTAIETYPELNFGRQVRYSDDRKGQPPGPFITIVPISNVQVGITQRRYVNQEDPDIDVIEQLVYPSELGFSISFYGENARGELGLFIVNLSADADVQDFFSLEGMAYQRNGGVRDLSGSFGGKLEQRAQVDVFFSASIMPDAKIIKTIQEVEATGTLVNSGGQIVDEINLDITT